MNVYPSRKTFVLNVPEEKKGEIAYKIYGSNGHNPNTEPSACLGPKSQQHVSNYFPLTAVLTGTSMFSPLQQILYREFHECLHQHDKVLVYGHV